MRAQQAPRGCLPHLQAWSEWRSACCQRLKRSWGIGAEADGVHAQPESGQCGASAAVWLLYVCSLRCSCMWMCSVMLVLLPFGLDLACRPARMSVMPNDFCGQTLADLGLCKDDLFGTLRYIPAAKHSACRHLRVVRPPHEKVPMGSSTSHCFGSSSTELTRVCLVGSTHACSATVIQHRH